MGYIKEHLLNEFSIKTELKKEKKNDEINYEFTFTLPEVIESEGANKLLTIYLDSALNEFMLLLNIKNNNMNSFNDYDENYNF